MGIKGVLKALSAYSALRFAGKKIWRLIVFVVCIFLFLHIVSCSRELSEIYNEERPRASASKSATVFLDAVDNASDYASGLVDDVFGFTGSD